MNRIEEIPVETPVASGPSEAEEERRTSYLELFFDLVFVFAITGNALRWDDRGYFGFLVETNVIGAARFCRDKPDPSTCR